MANPSTKEAEEHSFLAEHIIQVSLRREAGERTLDRLLETYGVVCPETRPSELLARGQCGASSRVGRRPRPGVPSTLTPRDWGLGVLGVKRFPEEAAHSSRRNAECGARGGGPTS